MSVQNNPNHHFFSNLSITELEVREFLKTNSMLSENDIDKTVTYIKEQGHHLRTDAIENLFHKHISSKAYDGVVGINFNALGTVFIPLRKFGERLGSGAFRAVQLAVRLGENDISLVAYSKQKIIDIVDVQDAKMDMQIAEAEQTIIRKLIAALKQYPETKGVLKYIDSFAYSKTNQSDFSDSDFTDANSETLNASQPSLHGSVSSIKKSGEAWSELSEEDRRSISPVTIHSSSITERSNEQLNMDTGIRYIVTSEHQNAGNLANRIKLQTLSDKEVHTIIEHMLSGLVFLHKIHIFHSDITLENILLQQDLQTQEVVGSNIGDFGFASDFENVKIVSLKNSKKDYLPLEEFLKASECQNIDELEKKVLSLNVDIDEIYKQNPDIYIGDPIDEETAYKRDVFAMGVVIRRLVGVDWQYSKYKELIDKMTALKRVNRCNALEAQVLFNGSKNVPSPTRPRSFTGVDRDIDPLDRFIRNYDDDQSKDSGYL